MTSGKIADGAVTSADLAATEAVHSVTLNNCVGATKWTGAPGFARQPGFWMDPTGLVHLQGAVSCCGDATEGGTIFSLPAGYQPHLNGGVVRFGVLGGGAVLVQLGILDDNSGNVVYDGPNGTTIDDYISLDGVTSDPDAASEGSAAAEPSRLAPDGRPSPLPLGTGPYRPRSGSDPSRNRGQRRAPGHQTFR